MNLLDVNILIYAHRKDAIKHPECSRWLKSGLQAEEPCAVSELVLSSCLRIMTHPKIFIHLCKESHAKGNLVSDACHAALAIEHHCRWISTDRDFSKFPDLQWKKPF